MYISNEPDEKLLYPTLQKTNSRYPINPESSVVYNFALQLVTFSYKNQKLMQICTIASIVTENV